MQEARSVWYMNNPMLFDVVAPIDGLDPSVKVVMDAAVADLYVFDKLQKTVTTASGAGVTIIPIQADQFVNGDVLRIETDPDAFTKATITDASTAGQVTVDTSVTFAKGARVWKAYGDSVGHNPVNIGTNYGTAKLVLDTGETWGYAIEVPYTYDSTLCRRDLVLECYMVIVKAGTGARYVTFWDVIMAEANGTP